jgi:hypothetical protein
MVNRKEYQKKYYELNKDKIKKRYNSYSNNKYNNDLFYRLKKNIRNRIRSIIKKNTLTVETNSFSLVGCSTDELKTHIEKQFTNGMSWYNYRYNGWHIDHIIPLATAKTLDDLILLSHYTNLQPLWSKDNFKKGKKYEFTRNSDRYTPNIR